MNFTFDDEHLALRDAVRAFLDRKCTPDDVRAAWELPAGVSRERWGGLAAMGAVGALIDHEHGGLGLDEVSLVLALEESGRAALPEPLGAVAAVAAPLLQDVTSGEIGRDALARIAGGTAIVVARLPGHPFVDHAASADLVIMSDGADVHLVPRADVEIVEQPGFDRSRRRSTVSWSPTSRTRAATDAAEAIALAVDRRSLAEAAASLGCARRLIDMATEYALTREQFGAPIGTFQAIKHHLASAKVRAEFAAPAVYRAAWSIATDQPGRTEHAAMARTLAARAAHLAGRTALQVHGAIGYTDEHDLHLWLRTALRPS